MGEQAGMWNGAAGRAWVDAQELLDQVLRPLEDVLVEAVVADGGTDVLDVGCGTGATTSALARRLGGQGSVTGVDVSEVMIAAARSRTERDAHPPAYVLADAETHAFPPARFDAIMSRFGVMFFGDTTRAFANLRAASRPGARLRLIVWRSAEENPFTTAAERAARPLLPDLPERRPDEPGQFALADPGRVERLLRDAGFGAIELRPLDVPCVMPERALVPYLSRMGPVGRLLPEVDEPLRSRVVATVREAFEPWVHGDEVRFTTACWMVTARNA